MLGVSWAENLVLIYNAPKSIVISQEKPIQGCIADGGKSDGMGYEIPKQDSSNCSIDNSMRQDPNTFPEQSIPPTDRQPEEQALVPYINA
jgi:hypothetical protein